MDWFFVAIYWTFAFSQALVGARWWHRRRFFDQGDLSPKGVFLLMFFFAPIASVFIIVGVLAWATVWCIERMRLDEHLDKLIEWKNK